MTLPLRGGPDFGTPPYLLASKTVDPGLSSEFSALGLARLDSQGRPWLFDDFRGGIVPYTQTLSGSGAAASSYGLDGFSRPQCARLTSGAGGGAKISRSIAMPPSARIGLEAGLNLLSLATVTTFGISLSVTTVGANLYWNASDGTYRSDVFGGGSVILAQAGGLTANEWAQTKIVADFSSGFYVGGVPARFNSQTPQRVPFANGMPVVASSLTVIASAFINASAGNPILEVGYLLVTVDEP